jgi:hypothetical protein
VHITQFSQRGNQTGKGHPVHCKANPQAPENPFADQLIANQVQTAAPLTTKVNDSHHLTTMEKLHPIITLIPQKLDSVNVIVAKGKSMSYFDTIRLAKRSSGICTTINLAIAAYEVCLFDRTRKEKELMKCEQGFTPNEEEGQILLEEMMKMIELTERQLALMVETKPVFEKLWVVGT